MLERLLPRERAAPCELLPQRPPVQVLEDHDELAVGLHRCEAPDEVRMLEVREDLHLVEEEAAPLLVTRQLWAEDLQRDTPLREALLRLVDLAHAALADEAPHQVFADSIHLSLRERQVRVRGLGRKTFRKSVYAREVATI